VLPGESPASSLKTRTRGGGKSHLGKKSRGKRAKLYELAPNFMRWLSCEGQSKELPTGGEKEKTP